MNDMKKYYSKYQWNWLKEKGYSIKDILEQLAEAASTMVENTPLMDVFEYWEKNIGFDGEIWEPIEKFEEVFYPDKAYMKQLLDNPDEYREYWINAEVLLYEKILFEEDVKSKFVICFPISNAICPRYCVYADTAQEALDKLMDYFVEAGDVGMYYEEEELTTMDESEKESFIPCGNFGYYFPVPIMQEISQIGKWRTEPIETYSYQPNSIGGFMKMKEERWEQIYHNIKTDIMEKTDLVVEESENDTTPSKIQKILKAVVENLTMPKEQFIAWLKLEVGVNETEMDILKKQGILPER